MAHLGILFILDMRIDLLDINYRWLDLFKCIIYYSQKLISKTNLRLFVLAFVVRKQRRKVLKLYLNNSMRQFIYIPWYNSASKMFVIFPKKIFHEMIRIFIYDFIS